MAKSKGISPLRAGVRRFHNYIFKGEHVTPQTSQSATPQTSQSAIVSFRMRAEMDNLSTNQDFKIFMYMWRKKLIPKTPLELQKYYEIFHLPFVRKVIDPRISKAKYITVGIKSYIESWALYPITDLIIFFANMVARNLRVSKNEWDLNSDFKGIRRCRNVMRGLFPILMTDVSSKIEWDNIERVGGGAFLVWPNNSFIYKCGRLPIVSDLDLLGSENHPAGDRMVVYELWGIMKGLQWGRQYIHEQKLGIWTDNLYLSRVLTGEYSIPQNKFYPDFIEVISQLRQLDYFVMHIYREQNFVADHLAFLGRVYFEDEDWDRNWLIKSGQFIRAIDAIAHFYLETHTFIRIPRADAEVDEVDGKEVEGTGEESDSKPIIKLTQGICSKPLKTPSRKMATVHRDDKFPYKEVVDAIQEIRKAAGLEPTDTVDIFFESLDEDKLVLQHTLKSQKASVTSALGSPLIPSNLITSHCVILVEKEFHGISNFSFSLKLARPSLMVGIAIISLCGGDMSFVQKLEAHLRSRNYLNLKSEFELGKGKITISCIKNWPPVEVVLGKHVYLTIGDYFLNEEVS